MQPFAVNYHSSLFDISRNFMIAPIARSVSIGLAMMVIALPCSLFAEQTSDVTAVDSQQAVVSSSMFGPQHLQLASQYQADAVDVTQYLLSEKLDGVRAYWDGQQLWTRQGRAILAPDWFIAGLPKQALDGELWFGRGQFERSSALVQRLADDSCLYEAEWRAVQLWVFDLPRADAPFTQRYQQLQQLFADGRYPSAKLLSQMPVLSAAELQQQLAQVEQQGGEGLMLHLRSAHYQAGRVSHLQKVKSRHDAEATVLAHIPGKGKYQGMLGALLVQTSDGITFKIGSGFSDDERRQPPPIGAIVTFSYQGLTNKGTPRFASFKRVLW